MAVQAQPAPAAESKLASSTVSLAVDPKLDDGRMIIRIAAQNRSSAAVNFGPSNVTIQRLDGVAVPLVPLDSLVDDVRAAAGMKVERVVAPAPTAGAYAAPQNSVNSAGMIDTSGNITGSTSIASAETVRQSTRERRRKPTIGKAEAERQIAALKQGILQEKTIAPGHVAAGQIVTAPLKLKKGEDRTLHIWVRLAGDEHTYTIAAPAD
jgi:hypothetical protein